MFCFFSRCGGVAGINVFRKREQRACVSADNRMCVSVINAKETNLFKKKRTLSASC